MSYLHCPTCARAYNVSRELACPHCGVRAGSPSDPTDDVVAAAEQLARAMARATPAQLDAAHDVLEHRRSTDRRALAAGPVPAPSLLAAIRTALVPVRSPVVTGRAHHVMLAGVVIALLTRVAPQRPVFGLRKAARALLGVPS